MKAVKGILLKPPLTPQNKKYGQEHIGVETKLKLNLRIMNFK